MTLPRYDVLGVSITTVPKRKLLRELELIAVGEGVGYVATVNPEFVMAAQNDNEFRTILSHSACNSADGIGIVWAAKFLSLTSASNSLYRFPQVVMQWIVSLGAVIISPKWLHSVVHQRAPGTELFWDIAKFAEQRQLSIFLIGGFGDTPTIAGGKLIERFPKLKLAGTSNRNYDDGFAPDVVAKAKPDIVYVAFGGVRQEKWIAKYQSMIGAKLMIGLGGTFDYVAGVQPEPPKVVRKIGLEWLYRLLTQPKRYKRIFIATVVFPYRVLTHKLKSKPGQDVTNTLV